MSTVPHNVTPAPILILYTGGTIGMVAGSAGWQASAGFDAQLRAAEAARCTHPLPWVYQTITPPIDSANMTQAHWFLMRDHIVRAVASGDCSGVLILHGTDTLAYTAAALSFLLLGLPVPVCITGAMLPAQQAKTDAWDNVFGALQWLRHAQPGGVHVFFHGQSYHGTQVTKRYSDRKQAFEAMRPRACPTLSVPDLSCTAHPLHYRVQRHPTRLGVQPLYPDLAPDTLAAVLETGVRGLVLELYGTGTGPADDPRFLRTLQQAQQDGMTVVGISQCPSGVMDASQYAAGQALLQCGVLASGTMTREAALGKLLGLLGAGLSAAEVKRWWSVNLCGEWG